MVYPQNAGSLSISRPDQQAKWSIQSTDSKNRGFLRAPFLFDPRVLIFLQLSLHLLFICLLLLGLSITTGVVRLS